MGVRGKGFWSAAVFEAPAVVASFDDIAVMGDAPKGLGSQRGGHFGVAEHGGPFSEGEIGGDDDRGLFVELAEFVRIKPKRFGGSAGGIIGKIRKLRCYKTMR
jgi:hypothetical protein